MGGLILAGSVVNATKPTDRKRHEGNVSAGPSWMLNCCALVAARVAPGASSGVVAGSVWAPPDDRRGESHRRIVRTFFAIQPPPPTELGEDRPRSDVDQYRGSFGSPWPIDMATLARPSVSRNRAANSSSVIGT